MFTAAAAGNLSSQSHKYADDGSYQVTVSVTDDLTVGSNTFTIDVANAPPMLAAPNSQNATEGTGKSFLLGSFSDPGADGPWAVSVNWGDGSDLTHVSTVATGALAPQTHSDADDGTYTVTASATDGNGRSATQSFTISSKPSAPIVA